MPPAGPGESVAVPVPDIPPVAGEAWLTVRAVLAGDCLWAPAGHEIGWAQVKVGDASPAAAGTRGPVTVDEHGIRVGPGLFDPADGRLTRLGTIPVEGPRLDVWRAPIDNERWFSSEPNELAWKNLGLHRMQYQVDDVVACTPLDQRRPRRGPGIRSIWNRATGSG